jgi:hypothetical protein
VTRFQMRFDQRQREQRGMSFVHVIPRHAPVSNSLEDLHASNSENSFLAEAIVFVTAVQIVGHRIPLP